MLSVYLALMSTLTYCARALAIHGRITSSANSVCTRVREYPIMEAGGEAGGEDHRSLLLFRSDFSGFEQLEPRDG